MRLSDTIEQFIKTMLVEETQEIELKRNELAEYFNWRPFADQLCAVHPLYTRSWLYY